MKRWALVAVAATLTASVSASIGFEDLSFASGDFENGQNLPGFFDSNGARFTNAYNASWGSWSGFSYSRVRDTVTPGFGNQYAVYDVPSGGFGALGSSNYAVAYGSATVDLGDWGAPQGLYAANTTYAALAMRDGDAFSKKFGGTSGLDPDWLKLTITGKDAAGTGTGSVDFYLADFRSDGTAADYIVDRWTWVDLGSLGAMTQTLEFSLSGSDVGPWGLNTPAYFAIDGLAAVPEPGTLLALGAGAAVLLRRRRKA